MLVQKSRATSEVNLLVVKPGQPISMSRLDKLVYIVGLDDGALKSNGGNG